MIAPNSGTIIKYPTKYPTKEMPAIEYQRVLRKVPSLFKRKAHTVYPLIYSNNMLSKYHISMRNYQGDQPYDTSANGMFLNGQSPVFRELRAYVNQYKYSDWDKFLNPQLYNNHEAVTPTPEFIPWTRGKYNPILGWLRPGGTNKFSNIVRGARKNKNLYLGSPVVEGQFGKPVILSVPSVGPYGPEYNYEGKLSYVELPLSKVVWMIDIGRLNRNEVITLKTLLDKRVLREEEMVWPGVCLTAAPGLRLRYPVHLELQRATPAALEAVEGSGGGFVAAYLAPEALHAELAPHRCPAFADQHLPDQRSLHAAHGQRAERGFLAQWHSPRAHPAAAGATPTTRPPPRGPTTPQPSARASPAPATTSAGTSPSPARPQSSPGPQKTPQTSPGHTLRTSATPRGPAIYMRV